jgi:hypothetical protein
MQIFFLLSLFFADVFAFGCRHQFGYPIVYAVAFVAVSAAVAALPFFRPEKHRDFAI